MAAIILAALALIVAVVALIIAMKNKREVITKTEVRYAPVEHPFTYDSQKKSYVLDGDLFVKGSVTSLSDNDKED